ncbi:MAG: TIGR03619 family F420-dependent LLM class oxidoreductase [Myxococcales bacterium]|nr:TIGR03619 family F420-dependent LLM class oxidoreductase [Myxococcales bacterium]
MDAPLRFGLVTPIVTLLGREKTWEADAGPAELREIAVAADRLGFEFLTCSEHVGIPTDVAPVRGSRYYDPLATFGFMAALTTRIRFLTNILVLPYHHPLSVAKRYGTLDRLCDGRLMLGVGVGSLEEEFNLLGAQFEGRGAIYSEALTALRASFGRREPVFEGEHFSFSDFIIDPCGVQQSVPIWLGGRTALSLRRALAAADGWTPFSLGSDEVADMLAQARGLPEWKERTAPFDVALGPAQQADVTQPDGVERLVDGVASAAKAGASVINLGTRSTSLAHYLDQLETIAARVMPRFSDSGN